MGRRRAHAAPCRDPVRAGAARSPARVWQAAGRGQANRPAERRSTRERLLGTEEAPAGRECAWWRRAPKVCVCVVCVYWARVAARCQWSERASRCSAALSRGDLVRCSPPTPFSFPRFFLVFLLVFHAVAFPTCCRHNSRTVTPPVLYSLVQRPRALHLCTQNRITHAVM